MIYIYTHTHFAPPPPPYGVENAGSIQLHVGGDYYCYYDCLFELEIAEEIRERPTNVAQMGKASPLRGLSHGGLQLAVINTALPYTYLLHAAYAHRHRFRPLR